MPITASEFAEARALYNAELMRRAQRSGPCYSPTGHAIAWHDQYFGFEIEPAGKVTCPTALAVGSTMSQLDVVLIASHKNAGPLVIPVGSTITLSLSQGDAETGVFEAVGPTVCVMAPAAGFEIYPDRKVCRFPIGDFTKPWLMVSLEFSGAITGGALDCALGFIPR